MAAAAAAFSSWQELVLNYLKATKEYQRTGSEEALKTTVNVDQGWPGYDTAAIERTSPERWAIHIWKAVPKPVPNSTVALTMCRILIHA